MYQREYEAKSREFESSMGEERRWRGETREKLFGEFTRKLSARSLCLCIFLRSVGVPVIHGANFVLFVINPLKHEQTHDNFFLNSLRPFEALKQREREWREV